MLGARFEIQICIACKSTMTQCGNEYIHEYGFKNYFSFFSVPLAFFATFMDRNSIGMGFKFALPKWAPWLNEPNGIIFWQFCKKKKKKLNEKNPNVCIMNIRDEYHSDRSEGQQVVIPVAVAPAVPTGVLTLLQDIHLSTEVHLFPTHPTK